MIPPELAPLGPRYAALYERAVAVLSADPRVRAVWLGGSVARGVADAGSDLDLIVAVRDEDLASFREGWRGWLDAIAPTILARPMPDFLHSVTATCERLDVVHEPVSALAETAFRHRLPVHDPDGLNAAVPPPPAPKQPDPQRLHDVAEEFLRQQSIFPVAVVARADWLLGVVGVQQAQLMLYEAFAESNQPLPPMGVKQWTAKLTPEQRAVLTGLRVPQPEREDLVAAMRQTAAAWREHGRAAVERAGGTWPVALDEAVAAFWRRELPESPETAGG
ncbi:MAG TPA: nucleotidyltransferase domain-containing protein [Mycobacteriales bacterium]|nr:nucleotidyltransferase domain-containing protein [Mycobacteriales bacterium]